MRYLCRMARRALPEVERVIRTFHAADDALASSPHGLLARIRRVVPVDAAFFATCDPETLLFTSVWAEAPLAVAGARFLDNEFGDPADVNRFATLAAARRPVATLDAATAGDRAESRRYREIMAPLRLGDELRVALRSGTTTWGFLCLHRGQGQGFSPRAVTIVERVAPHAAEAIRRSVLETMAKRGEGARAVGTIIVERGAVAALTPAAESLLEGHLVIGDPLPLPLAGLIRRLEAIERATPHAPQASLILPMSHGALEVHASRLTRADGTSAAVLTLTEASGEARSSLKLSAHGLTQAQRRVTALVLRGLSTRQIVRELQVSEHTVQDHLKVVFDKLGVCTRRELVATLMR